MSRAFVFAVAATLCACGGAASESSRGSNIGPDAKDREFSTYASKHGLRTLESPEDSPATAAEDLHLERVDRDKPIELDGVLEEWPPLVKASTLVAGSTKSVLKTALAYDDTRLYVGAEVTDAAFAPGKDHLLLVLAIPTGGGVRTLRGGSLSGKVGRLGGERSPGRARLAARREDS